jgi:hypothetical protein
MTGEPGAARACLRRFAAGPVRGRRDDRGVAPHSAPGLDWLAGMAAETIAEFGAAVSGEAEPTLPQAENEMSDPVCRECRNPQLLCTMLWTIRVLPTLAVDKRGLFCG